MNQSIYFENQDTKEDEFEDMNQKNIIETSEITYDLDMISKNFERDSRRYSANFDLNLGSGF